jgi:hypothetical protein
MTKTTYELLEHALGTELETIKAHIASFSDDDHGQLVQVLASLSVSQIDPHWERIRDLVRMAKNANQIGEMVDTYYSVPTNTHTKE